MAVLCTSSFFHTFLVQTSCTVWSLQCPFEERRQAELPLHQVAHKHHQVVGKALIHEEVALYVILCAAVFSTEASISLKSSRWCCSPASAFCARLPFLLVPNVLLVSGFWTDAWNWPHQEWNVYVGDAQIGGYHRLEIDACQRNEVFHVFGRCLSGIFVE